MYSRSLVSVLFQTIVRLLGRKDPSSDIIMRFNRIGLVSGLRPLLPLLLLLLLLVTTVSCSWQGSIAMDGDVAPGPGSSPAVTLASNDNGTTLFSGKIPTFDDERIKHHPDKVLLGRIRTFFKAFTTGDFDGMRELQSKTYTMTNIHFGVVRASREEWYQANKQLTGLISNLRVVALNLYGSCQPGHFSILEHVTLMELNVDPSPEMRDKFPEGSKAGDTVGIVNLSTLWWDARGLISREFEYGGLTWKGFSLDQWDKKSAGLEEEEEEL